MSNFEPTTKRLIVLSLCLIAAVGAWVGETQTLLVVAAGLVGVLKGDE